MIKLIGALIVIGASTAYGFYKASTYSSRLEQIKHLIYCLKRLKTDIQFGLTPLPDAFIHIAQNSPTELATFFKQISSRLLNDSSELPFSSIWNEELRLALYNTDLLERHYDVLMQLGTVLGSSDALDQQHHLQTAIERLMHEESIAVEERSRYASLWRSIGALTGVTLVILLI